ncbi:unnamed protein product [Cuscuta epithymum]|uniref:Uncharacterized protein n=1 Tax=Cuscuta epithymum TaxID=186058 RepID=A0AAV0CLP0_9ASTE|nr:unnamed protein product [Cuscuta epithymum]CAH9132142.1 unnamed protein product [Cuscuta epithymum]
MAIITFPASSVAALPLKSATKKLANGSHPVFGMLRPRRVFARRSLPGKMITPVKKPSRHVISSTRFASISFSGDCCNEFDSDCESSCSSTASNPRPEEDDDTGKKDVPMWMIVPKSSTSFVLVRIQN